jgi:hypothetical protein
MTAIAAVLAAGPASAQKVDGAKLLQRALAERGAYQRAVRLADEVGARLAGSAAGDRAVAWAVAELKASGFSNVHTEPVTVQSWRRGPDDRVELLGPNGRRLHALALGLSPGTRPEGVRAEVVEVDSFAALHQLGDKVRGKIVFYNRAMKRSTGFDQYGTVGALRFMGAAEAGKLGAVGAVVRSIGTGWHRLPHTGATEYEPGVPKIPFAALAAEDAELLHRALQRGPQQLALSLSCGPGPKVQSANVVGELPGRGHPEQIVLLGAHLDSWDVGDGALDDGAGVGIAIEAARLAADLHPKRTLRVVLYMNEEYELSGAKAYADAHATELGRHVAAMEADAGAGPPLGFDVVGEAGAAIVRRWLEGTREPVKAVPRTGSDLTVLAGVPQLAIDQDVSDYFEWHHTDGDTADKIDPEAIERSAAAFARLAAEAADRDETLPRLPPNPPRR